MTVENRFVHKTSGRWRLGFILALSTAVLWGVLPIALEVVLKALDPFTVTWIRFAASGLFLGVILAATGGLPPLGSLGRRVWILLTIAFAGLTGNYVLYIVALVHTSPTISQTVAQLGPMLLLLGGLIIFKERFSGLQWLGFAVLIGGLVLFFHNRLLELQHISGGLGLGVAFLIIAAIVWSAYGLAQKRLLRWLDPQQILLFIYLGATIALFPWTALGPVRHLNVLQFSMLTFCCLNTLLAYGAFAEGLKHWEVSRFSAVLATAPLFTVAGMWIVGRFVPGLVASEHLDLLSILGTLFVVAGSVTCAVARRN
jgi:drug/metabolite transporter (DMT)-like permease